MVSEALWTKGRNPIKLRGSQKKEGERRGRRGGEKEIRERNWGPEN